MLKIPFLFKSNYYIAKLNNPNNPLCPLDISTLYIDRLANTFYKKTLFEISNETFDSLDSIVFELFLDKIENIDIYSKMLNPTVFRSLREMTILGFVNSISGNAIFNITYLEKLSLERVHFRSLLHRNGITWIKEINKHLNVNLSNLIIFENETNFYLFDFSFVFQISLDDDVNAFFFAYPSKSIIKETFPVEYFCIYRDFPFYQHY